MRSDRARSQAAGDLLLRFMLDMKRKLLVELAFSAAWIEQRPKPKCQVANIHDGYASFITRPIAVDIRSHVSISTLSCRRPDGVSR